MDPVRWFAGIWHTIVAVILLFLSGCLSPQAKTVEQQYFEELVDCVHKAETRSEADLCRSKVDDKYGVK